MKSSRRENDSMTMSTTWSYTVFSVMVWMYVLRHHAIDSCYTREYIWSILLPNTLSRTMIRSNGTWRGRKGYYTRGHPKQCQNCRTGLLAVSKRFWPGRYDCPGQ